MDNTEDSERTTGIGMQGGLSGGFYLFPSITEQTFSESSPIDLISTLLCAIDTEMNKTF